MERIYHARPLFPDAANSMVEYFGHIWGMQWKWIVWVGGLLIFLASCGERIDYDARVFRYNESAGLTNLDPAHARTLEPMWVVDQLFDGLVELSPTLEIVPSIARRWEADSAGVTWTFVLRDDVRFAATTDVPGLSDGRSVVAADFVYSLNRLRDPAVASAGAWILEALDSSRPDRGIEAPNDSTVVFHLRSPFPVFLGLLATPYASVVPHEAVSHFGADFRAHPVGTGPFALAWWLEDIALVMHRNPDYWERDSAGVRLPYLEAIHVDFAADMSAEFQGLVQGKYDFMSGLHVAYMDALLDDDGDLRASWNGRLRMERIPFLKTDYIGIQMDSALVHPALADRRVRQALSLAIDRQAMARHLRRGSVMPSARFVPPSMLGETKNTNTLELASALGPVPAFDRDSARALLAAGGYPGGEGIDRLTLSTTSDYTDLCASLQSQWAAIGIDIAIDVVQSSTHRENVSNGQATLFRKSWLADYPDAENFLALFLDLNDAPSGPNYTRYSHPDFERLYRQALLLADAADRQPIYRAMDDLIATELPVIPLFHAQVSHFLRPEIEGWAISPVNRLDLRRVKKRARN